LDGIVLICFKIVPVKYSDKELIIFGGFGFFLFWFVFQLWGLPSALAGACAAFLLPGFVIKRQYVYLFGCLMALVIVFGTILLNSNVAFPILHNFPNRKLNDFFLRSYSSYLLVFFFCIMGTAIGLVIVRLHKEKEHQKLQSEVLIAELNFLKAQINPHFLFNCLNSIYYQIDKTNATARDTVSKFSDLLRYQLYHSDSGVIDIGTELTLIKSYVELERLRLNSNYNISYIEKGLIAGFTISPLLLIPIVENSFKYVSHFTEKVNLIELTLEKTASSFVFTAYNTVERTEMDNGRMAGGGIGLKSTRRRLQLLYPGKHQVIVQHEPDYFNITLTLMIDENQVYNS
jgi:two-component system LytT family sensor kinase